MYNKESAEIIRKMLLEYKWELHHDCDDFKSVSEEMAKEFLVLKQSQIWFPLDDMEPGPEYSVEIPLSSGEHDVIKKQVDDFIKFVCKGKVELYNSIIESYSKIK